VKNGANLLDRLIKDVVTESEEFDVEKFIPILQARGHADAHARVAPPPLRFDVECMRHLARVDLEDVRPCTYVRGRLVRIQ
jgi:hypothetical protein